MIDKALYVGTYHEKIFREALGKTGIKTAQASQDQLKEKINDFKLKELPQKITRLLPQTKSKFHK